MNKSFFQKSLEWVCETFEKDTSKMIIVTGALGWALSSLAQAAAIIINPKVSTEKKSFLLPQELMDGFINVLSFLGITLIAKRYIQKLCSTGKIAPQSVRNYLNKNKSLYHDKVGKLDFNLDNVLVDKKLKSSYESHKNFVTTMGTLGASILACNVVTPLIRNKTASKVQKNYIEMKNISMALPPRSSDNMKI